MKTHKAQKGQTIFLAEGNEKDILLRAKGLNLETARAVAGDYLSTVISVKEVRGYEALAYALTSETIDLNDQ